MTNIDAIEILKLSNHAGDLDDLRRIAVDALRPSSATGSLNQLRAAVETVERYYAVFLEDDTKERVLVDDECVTRLSRLVRKLRDKGYG
jgi:hypothetical protein